MKTKTVYACEKCGSQSPRWLGKCPECNSWNTLKEERPLPSVGTVTAASSVKPVMTDLKDIQSDRGASLASGLLEFDRVLGQGLPAAGLVLLTGDPGTGKSTLALQIALNFGSGKHGEVLYISGEETPAQIKARAERLGSSFQGVKVMAETNLSTISAAISQNKPALAVIDSVQTLITDTGEKLSQGTTSQIKTATILLAQLAHQQGLPILLIGHVTKGGEVAGPKSLEHLVDVVLHFEGEPRQGLRLLRSFKNRFGSADETGIFRMTAKGLQEVQDAATAFVEQTDNWGPGRALSMVPEGRRTFLVEVQSLVSASSFKFPRRTVSGVPLNRLQLILAVLAKNMGASFDEHDVFVNVASGFKLKDPSADLALALAMLSSLYDKPLPNNLVALGEVGLTGEIRPINDFQSRLKESIKLGFKRFVVPRGKFKIKSDQAEIAMAGDIREAANLVGIR